jgi:hypothetical protein
MRPLEVLLGCLIIASSLVLPSSKGARGVLPSLLVIMSVVALLHVLLEGARLSALPFYLALCALLLGTLFPFHGAQVAGSVIGFCLAVIGLCTCYMVPVISLPDPGGSFAIGTNIFYFVDPAREEQFAHRPGQRREFAAQVWYPAGASSGPTAPYRDAKTLSFRSAHLRFVKTHARIDAPFLPTQQKFPLIFFSPATGGNRDQNTYLTEALASHGYVVVAFDHPDSCARVAFPDGSVIHGLPDAWLNLESREALAQSSVKTEQILRTNVQDMEFALDRFEGGAADPKLRAIAALIDFSRIAAIGHSFGGAAAAELCRIDARFRAGINMDGWMFDGVNRNGVSRPFLFMIEDDPLWFRNEGPFPDNMDGTTRWGTLAYHQSVRHSVQLWGGCIARLRNGAHEDFADPALYRRPWPWQASRSPSIKAMQQAVKKLTIAFLDQNLKGNQGALASARTQLQSYFDLNCTPPTEIAYLRDSK